MQSSEHAATEGAGIFGVLARRASVARDDVITGTVQSIGTVQAHALDEVEVAIVRRLFDSPPQSRDALIARIDALLDDADFASAYLHLDALATPQILAAAAAVAHDVPPPPPGIRSMERWTLGMRMLSAIAQAVLRYWAWRAEHPAEAAKAEQATSELRARAHPQGSPLTDVLALPGIPARLVRAIIDHLRGEVALIAIQCSDTARIAEWVPEAFLDLWIIGAGARLALLAHAPGVSIDPSLLSGYELDVNRMQAEADEAERGQRLWLDEALASRFDV